MHKALSTLSRRHVSFIYVMPITKRALSTLYKRPTGFNLKTKLKQTTLKLYPHDLQALSNLSKLHASFSRLTQIAKKKLYP